MIARCSFARRVLPVLFAVVVMMAAFCVQRVAVSAERSRKRPNVILVMTDDQGYGDLHCLGNRIIKTPVLDRLYRQSVRLTNFHVDPTCSPTRSALMTGRYSSRTGVWHTIMGRSILRRDEKTAANLFAAGGYRTAIFGKWHLGDNAPYRPSHRGFQDVLICGGGGVEQTPDFWGNDYFDDTYLHNGRWQKYSGYCTDVFFDGALEFIETNRNRPFFLYLPTNAAHSPYNVAEKYSKPYLRQGVRPSQANFWGMITNIDENMERLLNKLKELNLEENTILIFMTDNGTSAGARGKTGFNAGMRGQKGSEYDGGHRVPFFIRWPAGHLGGGHDVTPLTAHIDVLPTLLDLCGLTPPADLRFDGTSLRALLSGHGNWPARTLFVHSQRIEHPKKWRKSSVMTDRWRLVNRDELYDISADPGQKHNVARRNADVVARLRKAYNGWWTDLSRRFGEDVRIDLGSAKENPTTLTCHDWHMENSVYPPWNQVLVARDLKVNGFWDVRVARAGKYAVTLRARPADVPFRMKAGTARLRIGDVDVRRPIKAGSEAVTFHVDLKPGPTRLQTWLDGPDHSSRGAYFVDVQRLD